MSPGAEVSSSGAVSALGDVSVEGRVSGGAEVSRVGVVSLGALSASRLSGGVTLVSVVWLSTGGAVVSPLWLVSACGPVSVPAALGAGVGSSEQADRRATRKKAVRRLTMDLRVRGAPRL